MNVHDYLRDVLTPANVAVAAVQRAGLPIDLDLLRETRRAWARELADLERYVEGEAAKVGRTLRYSSRHSVDASKIADLLFGGLKLEPKGPDGKVRTTEGGALSTDDDGLQVYASLKVPRPDDHPVVRAVMQIRSLAKGSGTYLDSFERSVRADGCCHPHFNWALRTSRLSAEDPPVHQIPERADKRVADAVKACIVPRSSPARNRDEWDPRRHGSCFRWDISGAEAAIRAATFTERFGVRDPIAWEYIRNAGDIHSKTASLIYAVPEGTYKKGTLQRDAAAKQTFFAEQFGADWPAVQGTIWKSSRVWIPNDEMVKIHQRFKTGYSGLAALYEIDKVWLGERMDPATGLSWCEDAYGRRRAVQVPRACIPRWHGDRWDEGFAKADWATRRALNHVFHIAANTPTQSTNASDNLWMLALCHHGEYVELRVPPMWEAGGVPFPEAAGWQLNGGDGPGGRPFQSRHINTVHDSGWGECDPGWLEPTAKLIFRRCTSLPHDWRLEADVPYRIDFQVGPDMSRLRDYNVVAKDFGMEPLPKR